MRGKRACEYKAKCSCFKGAPSVAFFFENNIICSNRLKRILFNRPQIQRVFEMADAKDNEIHTLKTELIKTQAEVIRFKEAVDRYKAMTKELEIKNAILEDRLKRKKEKKDNLKDRMKRMRPIETLDDL